MRNIYPPTKPIKSTSILKAGTSCRNTSLRHLALKHLCKLVDLIQPLCVLTRRGKVLFRALVRDKLCIQRLAHHRINSEFINIKCKCCKYCNNDNAFLFLILYFYFTEHCMEIQGFYFCSWWFHLWQAYSLEIYAHKQD